jgi:ankyrin repeat protein
MIASYFGLTAVVKILLESDSIDLNSKDGTYGRSAISWAAGNGFDIVVKLLIKGIGARLGHQATIWERSSNRFCGYIWPNTTDVCNLEWAHGRRRATA